MENSREQASRVPCLAVGDKIYVAVELDGKEVIDALTVTEVGRRHVWVSSFFSARGGSGRGVFL